MSPRRGLTLHVLFFVSGALGLVYELLWIRQFTAVFGATTLATTATLSGFFLGLATGSMAFGARARRWERPLFAFGLLEIGVGIGALAVGPILGLYGTVYPALYPALASFPLALALVKLLLAMVAVALPAFCMGGTLPTLAELAPPKSLGIRVGGLYAVNVLGATVGALAVPFLLLPALGVALSTLCAVAGSLTIGITASLLGLRERRVPAPSETPRRLPVDTAVLVLALGSGLATLGIQVLWARMFSLVHENSIYSFAVVISVFLVGLALGAALARRALQRAFPAGVVLGGAWVGAGLLVIASPRIFHLLTDGFAYLTASTWSGSLVQLLGLAALTMLPATLGLGMALPLLMELAARHTESSPGPVLGRLLAANTVGAILGPLVVTFLAAPILGPWWTMAVLGVGVAAAGAAALPRSAQAASVIAVLAALVMVGPTGLPPVRIGPGERVVSVREGSHGSTVVLADENDRWITQNNSYVLGGSAAAGEERFQAHLPLLLHPAPRRVAFLGLGTGITAGAALHHPIESVVALEIVPEVKDAARHDFADLNERLVEDPRVAVVADDGRHYLAARKEAFDVIVGDLLVPWRPGEAPLYSEEHFVSVRASLAADGVFCQWLPLYQLSDEQLAILLRTFVEVFPQSTLWRGNFIPQEQTLALVGQMGPQPLDPAAVDARVRRLASSVAADNPFLAHPAGLWLFLVGPLSREAPFLAGSRRNSDREPWVEILSARTARRAPGVVARPPLLADVLRQPLPNTPLRGLDAAHLAWRDLGAALARASLDSGPQGERAVLDLLRTLPPELRSALEVE